MNLFKKFFGSKASGEANDIMDVVDTTLEGVLQNSGLELSYDIDDDGDEGIGVEIFGEDEELLKEKEGQLLDAIQFFTKRVVQHQLPEARVRLNFDSNGFREETNQALLELADRLKSMALEKKKSVYCKALPPKDRRIIHQHLSGDERVKTRSVGDGHYKKIKIFPATGGNNNNRRGGGRRNNNNRRGNGGASAQSGNR